MAIMAIALLGCEKSNGNDPDNPDNPAAVMEDVALSGTVRDINGNPLSGVRVTTGSLNATTGSDGIFSFAQAETVDDRVIMKYEKSGYFTLTRSCEKDSSLYVEAMLYPQGNSDVSLQTTFDASTAKTLQVGGMKIDFPASSIVSADGKAYSGNVNADMLYLAPDNANFSWMMPGGDLTVNTAKNSEEMLLPYGISSVVLTDNAGNPLNIKENSGVEISFPVSAGMTNQPATVPLWSFNENKGVWLEDGSLTLQGNVYKGAVNHFSDKAGGPSYGKTTIRVRVTACDEPKEGAEVKIIDVDDWNYTDVCVNTGFTNSDGYYSVSWYTSKNMKVEATYNGQTKSMNIANGDYGLQIFLMKFDDACGAAGQLTVDGNTFPLVESESLIIINGVNASLELGNSNPYIDFVLLMNIPAGNNDLPDGTYSAPGGGILGGDCAGFTSDADGGMISSAQMVVSKSDNKYNITMSGQFNCYPFNGGFYVANFQLTYNGSITKNVVP